MNSLNKAQIIGNITRDLEVKQTAGGQSFCTLGVATNRYWTDASGQKKDEAEFHNVICWGKLAEICGQYLKKGSKVFFEGRLQTRSWEDEAGHKHYKTEIVANDMIMLGSKGESVSTVSSEAAPKTAPSETEKSNIKSEDLPF